MNEDFDFTIPNEAKTVLAQTQSITEALGKQLQTPEWAKTMDSMAKWKELAASSSVLAKFQEMNLPKIELPQPTLTPYVPYESPEQILLQNISEEIQSMKRHNDLARLEERGYSDSAKYLFAIVQNKPCDPSEAVLIKATDYAQYCADAYFEYGLYQLKVSGILWKYIGCENGNFLVYFTERGIELIGTKNPLGEKKSQLEVSALLLMSEYPGFERDFYVLINNEYMKVEDGKLCWLKTKTCLAEYFGSFGSGTKWTMIEKAFRVTNLKALFNNYENPSVHFQKLKEILKTYPR